MADENVVWVNANMDVDTKARLEKMAAVDDRSLSGEIRILINAEWARRFPVSVETAAAAEKETR